MPQSRPSTFWSMPALGARMTSFSLVQTKSGRVVTSCPLNSTEKYTPGAARNRAEKCCRKAYRNDTGQDTILHGLNRRSNRHPGAAQRLRHLSRALLRMPRVDTTSHHYDDGSHSVGSDNPGDRCNSHIVDLNCIDNRHTHESAEDRHSDRACDGSDLPPGCSSLLTRYKDKASAGTAVTARATATITAPMFFMTSSQSWQIR